MPISQTPLFRIVAVQVALAATLDGCSKQSGMRQATGIGGASTEGSEQSDDLAEISDECGEAVSPAAVTGGKLLGLGLNGGSQTSTCPETRPTIDGYLVGIKAIDQSQLGSGKDHVRFLITLKDRTTGDVRTAEELKLDIADRVSWSVKASTDEASQVIKELCPIAKSATHVDCTVPVTTALAKNISEIVATATFPKSRNQALTASANIGHWTTRPVSNQDTGEGLNFLAIGNGYIYTGIGGHYVASNVLRSRIGDGTNWETVTSPPLGIYSRTQAAWVILPEKPSGSLAVISTLHPMQGGESRIMLYDEEKNSWRIAEPAPFESASIFAGGAFGDRFFIEFAVRNGNVRGSIYDFVSGSWGPTFILADGTLLRFAAIWANGRFILVPTSDVPFTRIQICTIAKAEAPKTGYQCSWQTVPLGESGPYMVSALAGDELLFFGKVNTQDGSIAIDQSGFAFNVKTHSTRTIPTNPLVTANSCPKHFFGSGGIALLSVEEIGSEINAGVLCGTNPDMPGEIGVGDANVAIRSRFFAYDLNAADKSGWVEVNSIPRFGNPIANTRGVWLSPRRYILLATVHNRSGAEAFKGSIGVAYFDVTRPP